MKTLILAGIVGIISLAALPPTQAKAADRQSNNDTIAVRWRGNRYHYWHGDRDDYYRGNYWYGARSYYPPYYYGSYYTPPYEYYYSPYYPTYINPYYSYYGTYRPRLGLYLGF